MASARDTAQAQLSLGISGLTEESRAFLQARQALVGKVLFLLSGGFFLVSMALTSVVFSFDEALAQVAYEPRRLHLLATAVFGIGWVVGGLGRHSALSLLTQDLVFTLLGTVALAAMAGFDGQAMSTHLLAALAVGHVLIVRSVLVPSSGYRTLLVSAIAAAASLAVLGLVVGVLAEAPRGHLLGIDAVGDAGAPIGLRLANTGFWLALTTVAATVTSHVLFGLRAEVAEARQLGQYVLDEKIGEGGMGIIYRATHAMLRRETAVKLLPPDLVGASTVERFEQEVRQTARLTHPNTVAIFDYGRTPDGVFYYAMEYLDGLDLEQLVQETGPLPPPRAANLLAQMCASLAEAHDVGLVHRDVKPSNAIVTQRGGESDVLKVLDFGLVKDLEEGAGGEEADEHIAGTPLFMSPEAIKRPDSVGPPADVYALGLVGYWLLTGAHPFEGGTVVDVCARHLHEDPPSPSDMVEGEVPDDLSTALLSALHKDPDERPDVRALRNALLEAGGAAWTPERAQRWWATEGAGLRDAVRERRSTRASVGALTIARGR